MKNVMNNNIVYDAELHNGLINLIIYENATLKYFASTNVTLFLAL